MSRTTSQPPPRHTAQSSPAVSHTAEHKSPKQSRFLSAPSQALRNNFVDETEDVEDPSMRARGHVLDASSAAQKASESSPKTGQDMTEKRRGQPRRVSPDTRLANTPPYRANSRAEQGAGAFHDTGSPRRSPSTRAVDNAPASPDKSSAASIPQSQQEKSWDTERKHSGVKRHRRKNTLNIHENDADASEVTQTIEYSSDGDDSDDDATEAAHHKPASPNAGHPGLRKQTSLKISVPLNPDSFIQCVVTSVHSEVVGPTAPPTSPAIATAHARLPARRNSAVAASTESDGKKSGHALPRRSSFVAFQPRATKDRHAAPPTALRIRSADEKSLAQIDLLNGKREADDQPPRTDLQRSSSTEGSEQRGGEPRSSRPAQLLYRATSTPSGVQRVLSYSQLARLREVAVNDKSARQFERRHSTSSNATPPPDGDDASAQKAMFQRQSSSPARMLSSASPTQLRRPGMDRLASEPHRQQQSPTKTTAGSPTPPVAREMSMPSPKVVLQRRNSNSVNVNVSAALTVPQSPVQKSGSLSPQRACYKSPLANLLGIFGSQ